MRFTDIYRYILRWSVFSLTGAAGGRGRQSHYQTQLDKARLKYLLAALRFQHRIKAREHATGI